MTTTDPAVRVLPPVVTEREAARHLRNAHGYGADELAIIEDALCLHGSAHSGLIAPADLGHVHADAGGRASLAVRRAVGATLDDLTGTDT